MVFGAELNDTVNGLDYKGSCFMVAGYIGDYKLIDRDLMSEIKETDPPKTVKDFKDNRGYVDDLGYVWIYRTNPNPKEPIPWFTVVWSENEAPVLKFNPDTSSYDKEDFNISRVGDLSIKTMISETTDKPVEHDEAVLTAIARATATVIPVIEPEDDFLKKIVKATILEKGVNVKKYNVKVPEGWVLSNLINGLLGKTKTGPLTFLKWMELLDCDVEVIIKDSGMDKEDPLREVIKYDSVSGNITIGEEKDKYGPGVTVAKSIKG